MTLYLAHHTFFPLNCEYETPTTAPPGPGMKSTCNCQSPFFAFCPGFASSGPFFVPLSHATSSNPHAFNKRHLSINEQRKNIEARKLEVLNERTGRGCGLAALQVVHGDRGCAVLLPIGGCASKVAGTAGSNVVMEPPLLVMLPLLTKGVSVPPGPPSVIKTIAPLPLFSPGNHFPVYQWHPMTTMQCGAHVSI